MKQKMLRVMMVLLTSFVLVLSACGGGKKGIRGTKSIEVKVGEFKEIESSAHVLDVSFELSETGIAYVSVVDDKIIVKGVKAGDVTLKVYLTANPKDFFNVKIKVIASEDPITDEYFEFSFSVTAPEDYVGDIYIASSLNDWNPKDDDWKLEKNEGSYTLSKKIKVVEEVGRFLTLEYKYLSGTKWENNDNRTLSLVAGEAKTATDVISEFKEDIVISEPKEYKITFEVTIPDNVPETHNIYIIGSFNEWAEPGIKLEKKEGLTFTTLVTVTLSEPTLEFMIVAGETFTWDNKALKDDGSEYPYGDNMTHTLTSLEETVKITVPGFKETGLGDIGDLDEYEFTFEITYLGDLREDYKMFITGNFTGWSQEVNPLVKGEDGKYRITYKKPLSNLNLEYSIVVGTSFNWDHKVLKEDGSEYPEGENLTHTLTELTEVITFTAPKFKGVDDGGEEDPEYTVSYRITVPSDFPEGYNVYLLGTTNGWDETSIPLVKGVDGKYTVTHTKILDSKDIEYMIVAVKDGEAFSWDHKALKDDGSEYAFEENINHTLTLDNETVSFTVPSFKGLQVEVLPEPVEYTLNFKVNAPTNIDFDVYILGDMNDWGSEKTLEEMAPWKLVKHDTYFTLNQTYKTTETSVKFKFSNLDWSHVEVNLDDTDVGNRTYNLVEGTEQVEFTVLKWKGIDLVVEPVEHTVSYIITVPSDFPEGYNVYLLGTTNGWDETSIPLVKGVDGKYTVTHTKILDSKDIEYMIVAVKDGEAFSWNHKALKDDGSEYAFEENINHTLTLEDETISFTVPSFIGLPINTINFEITVPDNFQHEDYDVYVLGTFNDWDPAVRPMERGEDGIYRKTFIQYLDSQDIEYMITAGKKSVGKLNWYYKALKIGAGSIPYDYYEEDENINHTLTSYNEVIEFTVPKFNWLPRYTVNLKIDAPTDLIPEGHELYVDYGVGGEGGTRKLSLGEDGLYHGIISGAPGRSDEAGFKYLFYTSNTSNELQNVMLNHDGKRLPNHNRINHGLLTTLETDFEYTIAGFEETGSRNDVAHNLDFKINAPTDIDFDVYILGDMNNWGSEKTVEEMAPWKLTKHDTYFTLNQTYETKQTKIAFKFSNLDFSRVEVDSEGNDIENRIHLLKDYTDQQVFTVAGWKSLPVIEYTVTYNISVPSDFPEGYSVYLLGSTNGWDETSIPLVKGVDGKYTVTHTKMLDSKDIEYMITAVKDGEAFSWDHKALKADGSEYAFGENINHTLTLEDETVSFTVPSFKGLPENTINFEITVPANFQHENYDVYVLGTFNGWDDTVSPMERGIDGIYRKTFVKHLVSQDIEYMITAVKDGEAFSWNHKALKDDGSEYTFGENINHTLTSEDETIEYEVPSFKGLPENTINFEITIPDNVPETHNIYIIGSFNEWAEPGIKLEKKEGLTFTTLVTVTLSEPTLEFMIVAGETFTWDNKALKDDGSEYPYGDNMTHTLTSLEETVKITVPGFKETGLGDIGDLDEYEFTFEITYPGDLREDYKMFITGNFTGWSQEVEPLLKGVDGKYRITYKKPLSNLNLEYSIVVGTSFNWDQKVLKEDGSEYLEGENLTHTLTELTEVITFTAPKFKGVDDGGEEHPEYTVSYRITVPSDFPEGYNVYLLGTTNGWDETSIPLVKGVDGKYTVTHTKMLDSKDIEYMITAVKDGEAFSWDHKALKNDGSEYTFGENRKHNLIDSVTPYEFTVVQWK